MTSDVPIWRHNLLDSQVIPSFHGETDIKFISEISAVTFKFEPAKGYCKVHDLIITSHRIHFSTDSERISIRLDHVAHAAIRGMFWRPKKIVLVLGANDRVEEVNFRFGSRLDLNEFLEAVTVARSRRAWLSTDGYQIRASVGGLSRVLARVDQGSSYRGALMDVGLSDLESLKRNAANLLQVVEKLKRSSTIEEQAAISHLLEDKCPCPTDSNFSVKVFFILRRFLAQSDGILLLHDAFCLLNRKLRMERVLTATEFLAMVENTAIFVVSGDYKMLVLESKLEAVQTSLIDLFITPQDSYTIKELGTKLAIPSPTLTRLLVEQIEVHSGSICRDEGTDEVKFFGNFF